MANKKYGISIKKSSINIKNNHFKNEGYESFESITFENIYSYIKDEFDKFQEFLETKTTIKPPLIYPDITDRSVSGYISAYLDKNGMFSHTFEKFSFNDDLKLSKTIKIIKYKEE